MMPPTAVPVVPMMMPMVPIDLLYVRTFLRDAITGWPDGRGYHGQGQPNDYSANGDATQEHLSH
jgi:hypothetical protein